jgi:hypothetical protein
METKTPALVEVASCGDQRDDSLMHHWQMRNIAPFAEQPVATWSTPLCADTTRQQPSPILGCQQQVAPEGATPVKTKSPVRPVSSTCTALRATSMCTCLYAMCMQTRTPCKVWQNDSVVWLQMRCDMQVQTRDFARVQAQNDMIAAVLARHNIKIRPLTAQK